MKIKQTITSTLKAFSLLLLLFLSTTIASAQCSITSTAPACTGVPITFFSNSPGATAVNWNFNSEGSSTQNDPAFVFNVPGVKTINLSLKTATGQNCNTSVSITVYSSPIIKVKLINNPIQCFQNNSFCFTDSSLGGDNPSCIKSIKYAFDDGELISVSGTAPNGVKMPRTFCKSFSDPAGGVYGYTVEIENCNGCITKIKYSNVCTVRASLGLNFTSNKPRACDSAVMKVTNKSTVPFSQVASWSWSWGDGTFNTTSWGPDVFHTFRTQGPNVGDFTTRLTVTTIDGCTETFTFNASATNLIIRPVIIATKDSTCSSEPEITFRLKGGSIPQGSNPVYNYGDPPTGPLNITRQWVGTHRFSGLGPYKINFSYTHSIPGCSKTVYDTVLIIGPKSVIEKAFNWLTDSLRFQCVIKDTVKFKNFSIFYHNDNVMRDDDSLVLVYDSAIVLKTTRAIQPKSTTFNPSIHEWIYPGFNKPLVHSFAGSPSGQKSLDHSKQQRGNSCILRMWDFDDDFCEKCTTDTKNGINVGKNCKFSKDSLPQHWYTPWDSIYMTTNSMRAEKVLNFNNDSGLCYQKNMWPSDSVYIIRDTILYYGDNPLALKTKDSVIYKNIKHRTMVRRSVGGPWRYDMTVATKFFIRAGDTVFNDPNNGLPPNRLIGQKYITIQPDQSLVIKSKTDSAFYNVWLEYIQDTIPIHLLEPWHKIWKKELMSGFRLGDSINPAAHRQKFYAGTTVRCFNVRLKQKDICHVLACESEAVASLALQPPSAKKLRKLGTQCLGGDQDNYGITFVLDDTKPGCSRTFAKINFDTALNKTGWVAAVGANLGGGGISAGGLPPTSPPYLGYPIGGPPGNRYSKQFTVDDIKDSVTGYINVGLIIGNGMWRDPNAPPNDDLNYPSDCVDTIYYPKFARFPFLDNRFVIVKPKQGDEFTKICRRDTICMALLPKNKTYIPDVAEATWSLAGANVGKYFNQYYILNAIETYSRFQKIAAKDSLPGDYKKLGDYIQVVKQSYFDGTTKTLDSQKILISRVEKWHTEADISPVFDIIKVILQRNNIDVFELTPAQLSDLIWNGKGTFSVPYTGSRGCLDTTGYGRFIRFYKVADQKQILHFRDTSLRPIDSCKGWDGKKYSAYCFTPQYSGYYIANYGLRSIAPENCTKQTGTAKKVIVGFYGVMNYTDTILCHGQLVTATPQFRYFEVYPEITFRLLDPVDYWRDRISEAGNINREGYTVWDLSKKDDGTNSKSIFGGFPYSAAGLGNPVIRLGGIASGIYYNKDTGDIYHIRTAASDSFGCKDTFPQDVYVSAVRANFSLDQKRPQCNTIIELFDSSYIMDPCRGRLPNNDSCDWIVKWTVDWGDKQRNSVNNFFLGSYPPQIGHDYTRNGAFRVRWTVVSRLGCISKDSIDIYIPGPLPFFDTFITRKYCVGEKVNFSNLSKYLKRDSSTWLWQFGDGSFSSQFDTITPANDTVNHRYKNPGRYAVFLRHFFKLVIGTKVKTCMVVYPDTTGGQEPMFYIDIVGFDTVKLKVNRIKICPDEVVDLTGQVKPYNRYSKYRWNFGLSPTDTLVTSDTFRTQRYSKIGKFTIKFKGDISTFPSTEKICAAEDSVIIEVAKVKADFDLDSSGAPVYCFSNLSTGATKYNWGIYGDKDVKAVNPASARGFTIDIDTNNAESQQAKICKDYRDSLGTYWVCLEAISDIGCKDTICKKLVNNYEAGIKPPNVFTPEGGTFQAADEEGKTGNDVFNIIIKGHDKYDLVIFDRWGVKVFESTDKNNDWNGKVKNTGANCPDGTYYYILRYRFKGKDKEEPILNGIVQLLRGKQ